MPTIIFYEVSSRARELKRELISIGYSDRFILENNSIIKLPGSSLFHPTNNPAQCKEDLLAITKKRGIDLLRAVSVSFENYAFVENESCY